MSSIPLPDELIRKVSTYLDATTFLYFSITCRQVHRALKSATPPATFPSMLLAEEGMLTLLCNSPLTDPTHQLAIRAASRGWYTTAKWCLSHDPTVENAKQVILAGGAFPRMYELLRDYFDNDLLRAAGCTGNLAYLRKHRSTMSRSMFNTYWRETPLGGVATHGQLAVLQWYRRQRLLGEGELQSVLQEAVGSHQLEICQWACDQGARLTRLEVREFASFNASLQPRSHDLFAWLRRHAPEHMSAVFLCAAQHAIPQVIELFESADRELCEEARHYLQGWRGPAPSACRVHIAKLERQYT